MFLLFRFTSLNSKKMEAYRIQGVAVKLSVCWMAGYSWQNDTFNSLQLIYAWDVDFHTVVKTRESDLLSRQSVSN